MTIEIANVNDFKEIAKLDRHIPSERLKDCILHSQVYILKADSVVGVLRFSLFWQTIPFLDLIFLEKDHRNKGYGTGMMKKWENSMKENGYKYVMTSTQADEDAWHFYEKLGYRRVGSFFPPEQEAEELVYLKEI